MFIDPGASGSRFAPLRSQQKPRARVTASACHRGDVPAKATTTGARGQVQSSPMERGRAAASSSRAFMPSPTAPKRVLKGPQLSTQPLQGKPQRTLTLPQLPSPDPGCTDFL